MCRGSQTLSWPVLWNTAAHKQTWATPPLFLWWTKTGLKAGLWIILHSAEAGWGEERRGDLFFPSSPLEEFFKRRKSGCEQTKRRKYRAKRGRWSEDTKDGGALHLPVLNSPLPLRRFSGILGLRSVTKQPESCWKCVREAERGNTWWKWSPWSRRMFMSDSPLCVKDIPTCLSHSPAGLCSYSCYTIRTAR